MSTCVSERVSELVSEGGAFATDPPLDARTPRAPAGRPVRERPGAVPPLDGPRLAGSCAAVPARASSWAALRGGGRCCCPRRGGPVRCPCRLRGACAVACAVTTWCATPCPRWLYSLSRRRRCIAPARTPAPPCQPTRGATCPGNIPSVRSPPAAPRPRHA